MRLQSRFKGMQMSTPDVAQRPSYLSQQSISNSLRPITLAFSPLGLVNGTGNPHGHLGGYPYPYPWSRVQVHLGRTRVYENYMAILYSKYLTIMSQFSASVSSSSPLLQIRQRSNGQHIIARDISEKTPSTKTQECTCALC